MVIEGSDTDMIVAQPLPLTDLFHDGLSDWKKCAEMAQKHPDRAVFWGSVNPLEGKKALDLMEHQVKDHGAKAFKFYNVRYDYGQPFPWRMDDPRVAFPVFEKAQELGVNLIGVHKGVPLGPQPVEHTRTFDMDGAAAEATRRALFARAVDHRLVFAASHLPIAGSVVRDGDAYALLER